MKTERRHELQTNELAHSLATGLEKARPYVKQVVICVVAVVALIVVVAFIRAQSATRHAEAWQAYFDANVDSGTDANTIQERLSAAAKRFPGTEMADRALLDIADDKFRQGAIQMSQDKKEASKHFRAAEAEYAKIQEETKSADVRNVASYALGQTHEMLSDVDKAIEEYEKVTGTLAELAKKRVEALKKEDTREFYEWYATAIPKPRPTPSGPGKPGALMPFEVEQPDATPFGVLPKGIDDPLDAASDKAADDTIDAEGTDSAEKALFPEDAAKPTPESKP
jgi:hypothetical protein